LLFLLSIKCPFLLFTVLRYQNLWFIFYDVLQGRTPLHVSAWQGHVDMVALLLTVGGADVNATDSENRTALHSASWQGHASIVRLLLEHGARPDHTCNQGATALGEMAH
jgi:hypothetical protein